MVPQQLDPIAIVEAAYTQTTSDSAWLHNVLRSFSPLGRDIGVMAYLCDGKGLSTPRVATKPALDGPAFDHFVADTTLEGYRKLHTFNVATLRSLLSDDDPRWQRSRAAGVSDALRVVATDRTQTGCVVTSLHKEHVHLPGRLHHMLRMCASHLAAGARLRRCDTNDARDEAVLDPNGRVLHAESPAHSRGARALLTHAVRGIELARSALRHIAPEESLELWQALVAGRWSLVDTIDSDGRRYLLARKNAPDVVDPRALSSREQEVVRRVVRGHSNKHIAFDLGITASTVAAHLRRAQSKLNARSRAQLIQMLHPFVASDAA